MISLERFAGAGYHSMFITEKRNLLPREFFYELTDDMAQFIVLKGNEPIGACAYWVQEGRVNTVYWFVNESSYEDRYETVELVTEKMIKQHHPERILIHSGNAYADVFNACRYYQKGRLYQKIIEPWRYMVSDSAFDSRGYIINQGLMKDLPFGWFTSMAKGCGWISAYNLLKMNHMEVTMQECAEALGRRAILGGIAGQESVTLLAYLRSKHLDVKMTRPSNKKSLRAMEIAKNGILLYTHAHGAHYTAFRKLPSGKLWFYNAVYGRSSHTESSEDFIRKYALFPFCTALYVKEENDQ